MFDFPIPNTPPRRDPEMMKVKEAVADAFKDFLYKALKSVEENGHTEAERVQAGLARRHSEMEEALSTILQYADPSRDTPLETVKEASEIMDSFLDKLNDFFKRNPITDETKPENT